MKGSIKVKKQGFWQVDLKIMLNGEESTIDDLTEETKTQIAEKIIEGYCAGEVNEEFED